MSNLGSEVDRIPQAKRARLTAGEGSSRPAAGISPAMNGGAHPIRKTFSRGAVLKLRLENFL